MGILTIVILGLTAVALLIGALSGLIRGRNRAILRLIMIVVCAGVAILLRGTLTKILMEIEIDGESLKQMLVSMLATGETQLPEAVNNLAFALVEVIIGLLSYFLLFFALRIVSFIIIYPICKIFVKKGRKTRRLWGALVGLLQGIIVAFVVLSPATGLIVQVEKLSSVKMEGKPLIEIPQEIDLKEYTESTAGQLYISIGNWYFNILTSGTTADGMNINLEDTIDTVHTVLGLADTVTGLGDSMGALSNPESSPEDKINALDQTGDALIALGNQIDGLDDGAKEMINELLGSVADMIPSDPEDENSQAMKDALSDLTLDDLNVAGVGQAMKGVSSVMENVKNETIENIEQEDIDNIVNGISSNEFILEMIPGDTTLIDVSELDSGLVDKFEDALADVEDPETKAKLEALFGLA